MFSILEKLLKLVPPPPNFTNDHAPMLAVTAIHATLLAIVLGVLATYGLYRRTVKDQLEMKLFEECRAINALRFEPDRYIPEEAITEAKLLSKTTPLTDLVTELRGIIFNGENVKQAPLEVRDGNVVPDNAAGIQGKRAFHLMLALVLHPPFQEVTKSFSDPTPVKFSDGGISSVRRWESKLDQVTSPLIQAYEAAPFGLRNVLTHYLIPAKEPSFFTYDTFEWVIAPFSKYLMAAHGIKNRVKEQLQEIDRHEKSRIGTGWLALGFLGASITFVISVLIPLHNFPFSIPREVILWEPTVFYIVSLLCIGYLIFLR